MSDWAQHTHPVIGHKGRVEALRRRVFILRVGSGRKAPLHKFHSESVTLGSQEGNSLRLEDQTVSRFHARIELDGGGYLLCDLESTNGTFLEGRKIRAAYLQPGDSIHLGNCELTFQLAQKEEVQVDLSKDDRFGALMGQSAVMRQMFMQLEQIAPSEATVLIRGETGCGKELVASEIHLHSSRKGGPFVVLDCAGLPPSLIEAELFGYDRGAFTGADRTSLGALEQADGGTLFIDEIGELPVALQVKLLRALETRKVKRLGSSNWRNLDLRIVAATHRDLAVMCNQGSFREDLYFRLAVVNVEVPPLRKRLDDIPLLIESMLAELAPATRLPIDETALKTLRARRWRGNVRELRNLVERATILGMAALDDVDSRDTDQVGPDTPFKIARARAVDQFEKEYLVQLLDVNKGNVKRVAAVAGVNPGWVFRLVKRHGIDLKRFR